MLSLKRQVIIQKKPFCDFVVLLTCFLNVNIYSYIYIYKIIHFFPGKLFNVFRVVCKVHNCPQCRHLHLHMIGLFIYTYSIQNNQLDTSCVVFSFTPNPTNPPWAHHIPLEGHRWRGQLCGCHVLGSQATGWARADWTGMICPYLPRSNLAGFWADVTQEIEMKH